MNYKILPPTTKRVSFHTCNKTNETIKNRTINCIDTYKDSSMFVLKEKINKIDNEWDTERVLETNAAAMVLLLSVLGYKQNNCRWFLLTGSIGFFLLQHALQGWCPPLPFIRKLGVRTPEEINNEKFAFKYIRGDFDRVESDAKTIYETVAK